MTVAPVRVAEENQPVFVDYVPSIVLSLEQMAENLRLLDEIRRKILRPGVDYDAVPGTDKPVLLKPGAERLLQFFGLGHRIQCVDQKEDWDRGFFYYRFKATIVKQYPGNTIVVAECEGSANSKESRYRDRWVTENKLKELGISTVGLETRQKEGRYGPYTEYKIENPDPFSLVNTLQKMAIKRALVGATLQATGTSGFFTQDLEDMDVSPSGETKTGHRQEKRSTAKSGNGANASAKAKAIVVNAMKEMRWSWDQLAEYASDVLGRPIKRVLQEIQEDEWEKILSALKTSQGSDDPEPTHEKTDAEYAEKTLESGDTLHDSDLPF